MSDIAVPELIRKQLDHPLPGEEAQFEMAHVSRRHAQAPPAHANLAGVMALLYPKGADWHIVFIERMSNNPRDRHRGQIGFPGGRYEEEDRHLRMTALRETEEEIGVDRNDIEVLGGLTRLYIPVSNFLVHPFVGKVEYVPTFRPQESEVRGILEVPFRSLVRPNRVRVTDIPVGKGIVLNRVPYFDLGGKVLWGATAMMLNELLTIYRKANED